MRSSDDAREDSKKETYLINTISAVNRIRWRPGHPEQLTTTSSVQGDNMIHLWNVRHPYLPLATLDGHDDVCGSIVWLDTPCLPQDAPALPKSPGGSGGQARSVQGGGEGQQQQQQQQTQAQQHRSTSSRLFGSWGAIWSDSFARHTKEEEDEMEQYSDYLGTYKTHTHTHSQPNPPHSLSLSHTHIYILSLTLFYTPTYTHTHTQAYGNTSSPAAATAV